MLVGGSVSPDTAAIVQVLIFSSYYSNLSNYGNLSNHSNYLDRLE